MRENLTSGSMWQGMETRRMPRRHSLTLLLDGGSRRNFKRFSWLGDHFWQNALSRLAHQQVKQVVRRYL
jgi:hypothetical protein